MLNLLDCRTLIGPEDKSINIEFRRVKKGDGRVCKIRITNNYCEQDGVIMYRVGNTITYMSEQSIPEGLIFSLLGLDCIDTLYIGGANENSLLTRIIAKTVTGFGDIIFKQERSNIFEQKRYNIFKGIDTTLSLCRTWFSMCTVGLIDAKGLDWGNICEIYNFISMCCVDKLDMSGIQLNGVIGRCRIASDSEIGEVDFSYGNLDIKEPQGLFNNCEIDTINMRWSTFNVEKLAKLLCMGSIEVLDISGCKTVDCEYEFISYYSIIIERMIANDADIEYEKARQLFKYFKIKYIDTNVECIKRAWEESK